MGAGLVFSSLPGHVEQMNGAANVLPFLSLAVLLGYTALGAGAIGVPTLHEKAAPKPGWTGAGGGSTPRSRAR